MQFGSVIQTLGFSGLVTFTALNTAGQTTIHGSNIITGTIKADRIDTTGLTIKDNNGNVIFGAGVWPNNLDNAYVTANSIGAIPTSSLGSLQNSNIYISSGGALQGIGSGNGTPVSNNSIIIDNSGQIQGIGSGSGTPVSNSKLSLTASSNGSIILNRGDGTNATLSLSSAGISALAYLDKINNATYIADGIIGTAAIAKIIYGGWNGEGNFVDGAITNYGTTGWAISKAGVAVFNNIYARGSLDVGNNDKYLRFSGGTLTVKGNIVCDTLTANNLITTGMIQNDQITTIADGSTTGNSLIVQITVLQGSKVDIDWYLGAALMADYSSGNKGDIYTVVAGPYLVSYIIRAYNSYTGIWTDWFPAEKTYTNAAAGTYQLQLTRQTYKPGSKMTMTVREFKR